VTLARRIIPCLDTDGERVVKGVQFLNLRDAGDPAALAARYNREGADELVVLDITASHQRRPTFVETIRRVAAELAIPLTAGGGIATVDEGRAVLRAGADKLTVNTAALRRPELLTELAAEFGSQAVVLAIDAKRVTGGGCACSPRQDGDHWEAFVRGGRETSGQDALSWASQGVARGAGEILLTSMDRDGTRKGFDLPLTAAISKAVTVPVIASGGADAPADFLDVFVEGSADAALAASIFHDSIQGLGELKRFLDSRGIPVRLVS
jgi:cyclase